MPDPVPVLFANEAFYLAFAGRDLLAMGEVWARSKPVTCIHPGASTLQGRDQVMRSWQAILANPASPQIVCRNATAHLFGDVAYVLCWEQIGDAFLIATNILAREGGQWRMVHHQASPAPPPDELLSPPAGPLQ